MFPSF